MLSCPQRIPERCLLCHIVLSLGCHITICNQHRLYISALSAVDPELHEAARIDGASRIQRILHINIPTILPTITILFILSVGSLASVGYEKIYLLQNDLNVGVSEVISTYVYKRGILNTNYSFSTAVGLFNNVVNIALLLIANTVSRRVSQTSLF